MIQPQVRKTGKRSAGGPDRAPRPLRMFPIATREPARRVDGGAAQAPFPSNSTRSPLQRDMVWSQPPREPGSKLAGPDAFAVSQIPAPRRTNGHGPQACKAAQRRLWRALLGLVVIGPTVALGPSLARAQNTGKSGKPAADSARREELARAFVEQHHPELATLIARLKEMSRSEYEMAIADLDRVRTNLENLRRRDGERYAVELDAWKARSRIDVLTARLAGAPGPDPKLEDELRKAFAAQVAVQIRQQELERARLQQRLKTVEASLNRLHNEGEAVAQRRYESALKKARGLNQANREKSKPAKSRSESGANKDRSKPPG